jgi:hypothetical protein
VVIHMACQQPLPRDHWPAGSRQVPAAMAGRLRPQ